MSRSPVNERESAGAWASLIARMTISSLFFAAAVAKWTGGVESLETFVNAVQKQFSGTWFPKQIVLIYLYITPFMETVLPIWLLVGVRLKAAWIVTSIYLISLAFGKVILQDYVTAANNYNYVLIAVIGLYLSAYDRFSLRPRRNAQTAELAAHG